MKLMGVDIGFSKKRKTTGIATLDGERVGVREVATPWESRKTGIPPEFQASVIAIDGPLLPQGGDECVRRHCEYVFTYAPFSRRCKPGLSHFGFGLELRRAATEGCAQFSQLLADPLRVRGQAFVSHLGPVVEAFPNAFLAVLISEERLLSAPDFKRGERFDWLYDCVFGNDNLTSTLAREFELPKEVWRHLGAEIRHEKRAALVCLLTAALAAQGTAKVVGDSEGGWFWLPPLSLWQGWAKRGLPSAEQKWRAQLAVPLPDAKPEEPGFSGPRLEPLELG